jgi:lipopolysaccharide export system permease protein
MMAGKGGKAAGFGLSLCILFVFYMLLIVALNIGEKGYIPSAIIYCGCQISPHWLSE